MRRREFLKACAAAAAGPLIPACNAFATGQEADGHRPSKKFFALPMAGGQPPAAKILERYGIPFLEAAAPLPTSGSMRIDVGGQVNRVFLLGMTESAGVRAWADPRDESVRYFVGDNLGEIRLVYGDGSIQFFSLILGESVWWGVPFYQYPNPFPTDPHLRSALALALRLYPAAPVEDGKYVAVIVPRAEPLQYIEIKDSPLKKGSVAIDGITVECAESNALSGAAILADGNLTPEFVDFARQKPLRAEGTDDSEAKRRLNILRHALYTSDAQFGQAVSVTVPDGFSGPMVTFRGTAYATILENAFYANVQDMLAKIDADGKYHTSTRGAVSWGPYGFGTYRENAGTYYQASWARDMGRASQELTELGYTGKTAANADFCLRMARLWQENPSFKFHGELLPPHWGRIVNTPEPPATFENDGHGLVALSLYKLWRRLPDRDAWLRSRWTDVKAAGDWIPWQFDHPEISQAADWVLCSSGEAAGGHGNSKGYALYPDAICMTALEALTQMAESIGETQSASLWRDCAKKMREALPARCLTTDPKYGRVWTIDLPGWPCQATALAPLVFLPDYKGFAPEDDDPSWRPANEAAYQRLIDAYRPFGFYGQAMGYGQGFVSQAALLLDRMRDATVMLDWIAKQIYDPRFGSFIVPEGVQIDPSGQFWYRAGDLGNGVQEAEIIKTLRIVIGVDDTEPQRLRIFPRMPYGWNQITVDKYPVLTKRSGKEEPALIRYNLRRSGDQMKFDISSNGELGTVTVRLGPFEGRPSTSKIRVNGGRPSKAVIEQSGDSWWARLRVSLSPASSVEAD